MVRGSGVLSVLSQGNAGGPAGLSVLAGGNARSLYKPTIMVRGPGGLLYYQG